MGRVGGRLAIALLALLVVAAGCGSGTKKHRAAAAAGPAVPWTSRKPAPAAPRTPVSMPCRAADLAIPHQVRFVPHLQGGIALVAIRNRSRRACRLTGRPRVRFVKEGGPVQVQRSGAPSLPRFPEVPYPPSSLLALRPGEQAALTVSWDNWCDPKVPGKPHLPPSALRVTLPGGRGHLDADYNAVPPCLDPRAPSTIGVSSFQPTLIPLRRPWTQADVRASIPGQPLHARRGRTLRFRVVLRNASPATVRFDRCPAYVQQLAPLGPVSVYELNCGDAHPIPPGGREAFAMRVYVPNGAPFGANGLFWGLDALGGRVPQLNARVLVDE
jgi:hypothetical protein